MEDSPRTEGQGTPAGIYQFEDTTYQVKALTVRRFQRLLSILAAVPLDHLIAAVLPEEGEAEIGLAEIGAAVFEILPKIDDENFVVELVSIALDISPAEAGDLPISIGGPAIADLFTRNLDLLRTSPSFSAIETSLQNQGNRPTSRPATRKSSPASEKSQPDKPEGKRSTS